MQLIQKGICDQALQKGKVLVMDSLGGKQLMCFKKEPKRYKSVMQVLSNRVERWLFLYGQNIVVLERRRETYEVRSAKPLDRLFQIHSDPEDASLLVLVFSNE